MKETLTVLWQRRITRFVQTELWRIPLKDRPWYTAFFIRQLRIVVMAVQKFSSDRCPQMASALTFYSLLSIVPLLAMAFGVAKGFGFEKLFETQLYDKFPGQEEVLKFIIDFAYSFLENVKGGMIAGIGAIVLFWAVINVLGNIENSFNTIWGVKKARAWIRKISDYLSIMLICPLLVIMSGSITVFITTQIASIAEKVALIGFFSPVIFFLVKLVPYVLIWILFTLTYMLMPNTNVDIRSGLISGIIAGTAYQLAQWVYIDFQIGMARNNAIYGSFSAFPLFLIWMQFSWYIVLMGAEIAHACQTVDDYELGLNFDQITSNMKHQLSLQVAHTIIHHFAAGDKPVTASMLSEALKLPLTLVQYILTGLIDGGIISKTVSTDSAETAFQPATDIQRISVSYLIDALDQKGISDIPVPQTREFQLFSDTLEQFSRETAKSPANKLLKDI